MDTSIIVDEKFSSSWKNTFFSSLGLAAAAFVLYLNAENVIWVGIYRLAAFISFSLGIFCLLKIIEGRKHLKVEADNNKLHITYLKNNKAVHEEVLSRSDINCIYKSPSTFSIPFTEAEFTVPDSWMFNIEMTDIERKGSLFRFGGKTLSVDKQNGQQLEAFLKAHDLNAKS